MSAFVCGLDVHKDSTYATILDPSGKIVNQTRMSNERVLSYRIKIRSERVPRGSAVPYEWTLARLRRLGCEAIVPLCGRIGACPSTISEEKNERE